MHCISNFKKGAFFIVITMLLFPACTRTSPNDLSDGDDNGGYASDLSRIEWANNDIISIADAAGNSYNGAFMRTTQTTLGTCATVGTDTIHTPHTLTIRFGPSDCICLDGKARRGTIIVAYNGHYSDTSQIHTITFDNYAIGDNTMSGTLRTIRVDTTVTGNWYYKVIVNDSMNVSLDPLNSMYVTWQGSLVRKWVTGYTSSSDRNDDVFSISGNATLTRPNGHTFSCDIAVPMQYAMNCSFAQSGVVDVTGFNPPMRVLNYGSGGCDNSAQLSIKTNVYTLNLTK